MAITINIYYSGKGNSAKLFAEEMLSQGIVDEIRKKEGNLRYDYFIPLNDPETVLLIDSWEDQGAIDRHHASPTMGKIAALRDKYDLHMRAERYRSDNGNSAVQDEKFLRR